MRIGPITAVFIVLTLFQTPANALQRPVHTYSIVARDPGTGEMGVAAQSHWFSIGPLVVWGEAGVGVVATQSFIDPSYGPLGLALMKGGRSAGQALEALKTADPNPEVRQVAMLDVDGNVAAHTGKHCIEKAGHLTGENFSVQANLMLNEGVPQAMAEAFRTTEGEPLAVRLLAALEAAQALGGDLRGKQSAAILVVKGKSTGRPWADRLMDLRIEDHPEPIQELKRLIRIHYAYEHMNQGDHALEEGDARRALQEYAAANALFPDNPEMTFWRAVFLINIGQIDNALPLFREVFAKDDNWAILMPRLVEANVLNADEELLDRILSKPPGPAKKGQPELEPAQ